MTSMRLKPAEASDLILAALMRRENQFIASSLGWSYRSSSARAPTLTGIRVNTRIGKARWPGSEDPGHRADRRNS
jgi:hypothetical protein